MGGTATSPCDPFKPIPPGLSPDRVHAALASVDRRALLAELYGSDGHAPLSELSRRLAGTTASEDEVERTWIRLHHVHVPHLVDAGYVAHGGDGADDGGLADHENRTTCSARAEEGRNAVALTATGTVLAEYLVD